MATTIVNSQQSNFSLKSKAFSIQKIYFQAYLFFMIQMRIKIKPIENKCTARIVLKKWMISVSQGLF